MESFLNPMASKDPLSGLLCQTLNHQLMQVGCQHHDIFRTLSWCHASLVSDSYLCYISTVYATAKIVEQSSTHNYRMG